MLCPPSTIVHPEILLLLFLVLWRDGAQEEHASSKEDRCHPNHRGIQPNFT